MASSNIRYGSGVTKEVGMDLVNLGVKNVCILTDKNVSEYSQANLENIDSYNFIRLQHTL